MIIIKIERRCFHVLFSFWTVRNNEGPLLEIEKVSAQDGNIILLYTVMLYYRDTLTNKLQSDNDEIVIIFELPTGARNVETPFFENGLVSYP